MTSVLRFHPPVPPRVARGVLALVVFVGVLFAFAREVAAADPTTFARLAERIEEQNSPGLRDSHFRSVLFEGHENERQAERMLLSDSPGKPGEFQPPPLEGYVVDGTSTLTREQLASLNEKLETFRKEKGFSVVAFVLPSLEGYNIEDVAYDTFNTWQVGDVGKDNGALLVIAPKERRIRIETGKGVGGELTDIESSEILRNRVAPAMRDGDLYKAIDEGTGAIGSALAGDLPVTEPSREQPKTAPSSPFASIGMILLIVLLLLLSIVFPPVRYVLFAILGGMFRGGGGGGGGGLSSGGGGGRSGGGGASESY
jgi:uncharacterized protein